MCYVNILPNDFCFDDIPIVRDNPKIQQENQWGAIWSTDYWSHSGQDAASRDLLYRPVTLSVLRLTRIVAGNRPFAFHILSLLLHAICTLLVALLVRSLFYSRRELPEIVLWSNVAAGVAAMIFAVLPIHSEAVASVVGQADLLATASTIGAILCHLRIAGAAARFQRVLWIIATACCAFIAMGAKENGICVVPLVFLVELFGLPRYEVPTVTAAPLPERRYSSRFTRVWDASAFRMGRSLYVLIPLAVYLLLRYHALGAFYQAPAPTKTVNVLVDAPAWQRALGVLQAWGMYWRKTVFPRELAIEYAINAVRLPTSVWQADVLSGLAWFVGLVVIAATRWKKGLRALPFLVLALILSYLPTSNLFVLLQVFFAERIWYLPSVFVAGLFAIIGGSLLERRIWRRVGVVLLCAMMVRCWIRNSEWKNNGTLFAATYADHPQSVMARHLYGQWLTQHGEMERGIDLIQQALEIDLGFTDAHRSLGRAFLKTGRMGDALRKLQIADMQAPGHPETKAALAEAAKALEAQTGTKLAELEQKAHEHPDDAAAQLELVRFLRSIGRVQQAFEHLEAGERQFVEIPEWLGEMAVTLVYLDRRDEAITKYEQTVKLDSTNAQLMVELGMLLIERRAGEDLERAKTLVVKGMALAPRSPNVYAALGEIRALEGDIAGAREAFRKAIQLALPGSEYARILAEREKALGL